MSNQRKIPRRMALKASGVAMALPLLEAMEPASAVEVAPQTPRRLLAVCNNLGFVPDRFFPTTSGRDYELSPYLSELVEVRDRFTVLNGVSHPGVGGSHASDVSFLTAAPGPGVGGFKNSISLDQYVALKIGSQTRFPSLTLGVNAAPGRHSLSWTPSGVLIPCEDNAADVYRRMFVQGTKDQVQSQIDELRLGRSIMDVVGSQSQSLMRKLGKRDRQRIEQFQTAVRDVELQLTKNEEWAQKPKPKAPIAEPIAPSQRTAFMEKQRLMYQMAKLALETDSTRAITLMLDTTNTSTVSDLRNSDIRITDGYHNLSHHGKNETKLAQLEAIDRNHLSLLCQFLKDLAAIEEGEGDLLSGTAVIYGSNLGDASKHTTTNMPILVAGGRFGHGQSLQFNRENNYPLANLFVSVLQQMGIEAESFGTSTGTMRGLDFAV